MWISRAVKLLLIHLQIITQIKITYQYVYDACELANELVQIHQFKSDEIDQWICLVYSESSFMTNLTGPISKLDKSRDFGLFQINSFYWCNSTDNLMTIPSEYNICDEKCENYLDDDLTDDVQCVRLIFSIHGFKAWYGYLNECTYSKEIFNDNCDRVATINSSLIQYIHKTRPYDEPPKLPDYNEKRDYANFIIKNKFKKKKTLKIDEMNESHDDSTTLATTIIESTSKSTTKTTIELTNESTSISTSKPILKKQFDSKPPTLKNNLVSNFRTGNRIQTAKMDFIMKANFNNEYRVVTRGSMKDNDTRSTLKFNLIRWTSVLRSTTPITPTVSNRSKSGLETTIALEKIRN